MSNRIIAVLLAVVVICSSVQARTNLSDWDNVLKLKVGSQITVATRQGYFEGEVRQVDQTTLTLLVRVSQAARQAMEIRREDVMEIRKPRSRIVSTALGFGIGLGVGIGVGAIVDAHSSGEDPGLGKGIFGMLGGLGGLGLGRFLAGTKGKKIYVAP